MTHNDVFLEALKHVDLAQCRGVGKHTCGFLEGCSGDEGLCFKRRLGNTEENGFAFSRHTTCFFYVVISRHEHKAIHLLAPKEVRVTWVGDANLLEHLRDDDFDMLVVNFYTLETVDFLDLLNEIVLDAGRPKNFENFMRIGTAFSQILALMN